jgi:hypothetical protein
MREVSKVKFYQQLMIHGLNMDSEGACKNATLPRNEKQSSDCVTLHHNIPTL